jgi:hypothetical protein
MKNPYVRSFLSLFALAAIQLQLSTQDYTAEDIATWVWWDWFKIVSLILASLATSAKMYFSSYAAEFDAKKTAEKQAATPTPIP